LNYQRFWRIKVRIRFLQRACDSGIHPLDIGGVWEMREELRMLTIEDIKKEKIKLEDVITAIYYLDEFLGRTWLKHQKEVTTI